MRGHARWEAQTPRPLFINVRCWPIIFSISSLATLLSLQVPLKFLNRLPSVDEGVVEECRLSITDLLLPTSDDDAETMHSCLFFHMVCGLHLVVGGTVGAGQAVDRGKTPV